MILYEYIKNQKDQRVTSPWNDFFNGETSFLKFLILFEKAKFENHIPK